MTYIKLTDRTKFVSNIEDVLGVLKSSNDNYYVKGEYLGFFMNRFVKRFMADPDYVQSSFNSTSFNEANRKALINAADSMAAMISRSDPIAGASELSYAISSVLLGFLGEAEGFPQVGYGVYAYVEGIFDKIKESVKSIQIGSQKDATMAFRRHLVIRGVLNHVMYRTFDDKVCCFQEDAKNVFGGVWDSKKLVVAEDSVEESSEVK